MKSRFLVFATLITSILTLQSCVTNYVVSEPTIYSKEYKPSAKLATIDAKRLEENKKILMSSFASNKVAEVRETNNILKKAELASAIKYNNTLEAIIDEAKTYLGVPYRYGGTTRRGIDCSAFVLSVFGAAAGVTLPRVSAAQSKEGESVEKQDLRKGDLVFFSHGRGIAHVGIVEKITEEGEVMFIHAATSKGVSISSLNDRYWGPRYRFGKRILTKEMVNQNLALNQMN